MESIQSLIVDIVDKQNEFILKPVNPEKNRRFKIQQTNNHSQGNSKRRESLIGTQQLRAYGGYFCN